MYSERYETIEEYIETKLLIDEWSPEQIAGRLALEADLTKVSAPTIYKYIRSPYGRQLAYELDLAKKKRRKSKAKCQHQEPVRTLGGRLHRQWQAVRLGIASRYSRAR